MENNDLMFEDSKHTSTYQGANMPKKLHNHNVHLFSNNHQQSDKIRKHINTFHRFDRLNVVDLGIAITTNNVILRSEGLKKSPIILISNNNFLERNEEYSKITIIDKYQRSKSINNIGHQRQFGINDNINNSSIGLGEFRQLKSNIEPYLRETDYLHFNFNAIRSSDIPCNDNSSLTGLTSEEACQIMRYLGESNNLKLITFEYNDNLEDFDRRSAELIAMMIWYLFEGLSIPKNHPKDSNDFKSFIVELHEIDYTLEFFQSNLNDKWWVKNTQGQFLPCSFEDYQKTINNDLPHRILNFLTTQ